LFRARVPAAPWKPAADSALPHRRKSHHERKRIAGFERGDPSQQAQNGLGRRQGRGGGAVRQGRRGQIHSIGHPGRRTGHGRPARRASRRGRPRPEHPPAPQAHRQPSRHARQQDGTRGMALEPRRHVHRLPPAEQGRCRHLARTGQGRRHQTVGRGSDLGRTRRPRRGLPSRHRRRTAVRAPDVPRRHGRHRDLAPGRGRGRRAPVHHLLPAARQSHPRRHRKLKRLRLPQLRHGPRYPGRGRRRKAGRGNRRAVPGAHSHRPPGRPLGR